MSTSLDRRPDPAVPRPRRQRDVVALVFGLLLTGVAGAALWTTVVGGLSWSTLTTAAPLALVVIGVVGLLLSRRR